MKLLATATKNKRYRWRRNITFTLEARLVGNQVRYYEITSMYESCLSEEIVQTLFPNGMIKDRPFSAKENPDFYAVLYRYKKRYKELYRKLKGDNTPKFVRTKFKK